MLAVGAGEGCLDIFLSSIFSFSPLWEAARYRLKYCLKELKPVLGGVGSIDHYITAHEQTQ